jgi:hypothetical protein
VATAADPTDPSVDKQGEGTDGTTALVNVVSAIGSGLGILGFVTLCGGAITWLRFELAGLPPEDAVAIVPKENLVSYGAAALVPAALAALGFVALLYLADSLVGPFTEWRSGPEGKKAAKDETKAGILEATAQHDRKEATRATQAREDAEAYVEELRQRGASEQEITAAETGARAASEAANVADRTARESEKKAKGAGGEAKKTRIELEETIKERRLKTRRRSTAAIFAVGGLIVVDIASVDLKAGRVVVLLLVVGAAGAFSLAVLQRTGSFAWLALSAFVSVGVFYGFLNYYKTTQTTKVEPAAAIRKDRGPVHGMFVAQTSDRVYLGTEHANRMLLTPIPRDEVVDLVVGERAELKTARWQSAQLALDLCADAPPDTPKAAPAPSGKSSGKNKKGSKSQTTATAAKPACAPSAVKELTAQAAH